MLHFHARRSLKRIYDFHDAPKGGFQLPVSSGDDTGEDVANLFSEVRCAGHEPRIPPHKHRAIQRRLAEAG